MWNGTSLFLVIIFFFFAVFYKLLCMVLLFVCFVCLFSPRLHTRTWLSHRKHICTYLGSSVYDVLKHVTELILWCALLAQWPYFLIFHLDVYLGEKPVRKVCCSLWTYNWNVPVKKRKHDLTMDTIHIGTFSTTSCLATSGESLRHFAQRVPKWTDSLF